MKPRAKACTCVALLFAALDGAPAAAGSRPVDLDTWMQRDLAPYVAQQLSSHPRFRNEPVRFVVMQGNDPQSTSNALALALRDQLRDALVDTPGVRIAWQPERTEIGRNPGSKGIDCTSDEVHYYIGLELSETGNGSFAINVRALDLEDRSWVAGFGQSWAGLLSSRQHRAWRQHATDPSFRGDRDVPYEDSQADLLAADLARDLACRLLRQVSAEYVVALGVAGIPATDEMLELIRNNLAQYRGLQFSASEADTNASIEGKAHRIDGDLYQYWVTVRPKQASAELPALSASAYVYLPEEFVAASIVPALRRSDLSSTAGILSSLRIVQLEDPALCATARPQDRDARFSSAGFTASASACHALQAVTGADAVLFFLQQRPNFGVVRLADAACNRRAQARIARAGRELRIALPTDTLASVSWRQAEDWQLNPATDTYYAIAVSDAKVARAVARHISLLPARCGASLQTGLEGRQLQSWLQDFASIAKRWPQQVDWQIVRVKSIY